MFLHDSFRKTKASKEKLFPQRPYTGILSLTSFIGVSSLLRFEDMGLYIINIRIEVELNQVPQCVRRADLRAL